MYRPRSVDWNAVADSCKKLGAVTKVAKEFGICTATVLNILKKLDVPRTGVGGKPSRQEQAQLVIDHILQNGGTVNSALRELNIKVSKDTVFTWAKSQNLRLADYRCISKFKA